MISFPDERVTLMAQLAMWRLLTAQQYGDWETPFADRDDDFSRRKGCYT